MKNWAVLFVKSGAEKKMVNLLKKRLDAHEWQPFAPVREAHRSSKGLITIVHKILFSGYVFIQTEIAADLIADKLRRTLTEGGWPENIYRILHYDNDVNNVAMRETERQYWERLLGGNFCVAGSVGIIEGNTIRVMSGPLIGREGEIRKINRHKREAVIEMEWMGSVRRVRVMLEVVGRVGREDVLVVSKDNSR